MRSLFIIFFCLAFSACTSSIQPTPITTPVAQNQPSVVSVEQDPSSDVPTNAQSPSFKKQLAGNLWSGFWQPTVGTLAGLTSALACHLLVNASYYSVTGAWAGKDFSHVLLWPDDTEPHPPYALHIPILALCGIATATSINALITTKRFDHASKHGATKSK